jgi:hypothetical protein
MTSSGISSPLSIISLAILPNSVPRLTLSRSTSPVDICFTPKFFLSMLHCVPFPVFVVITCVLVFHSGSLTHLHKAAQTQSISEAQRQLLNQSSSPQNDMLQHQQLHQQPQRKQDEPCSCGFICARTQICKDLHKIEISCAMSKTSLADDLDDLCLDTNLEKGDLVCIKKQVDDR